MSVKPKPRQCHVPSYHGGDVRDLGGGDGDRALGADLEELRNIVEEGEDDYWTQIQEPVITLNRGRRKYLMK